MIGFLNDYSWFVYFKNDFRDFLNDKNFETKKRNKWGGLYFIKRGEIQWLMKDKQKRKHSTKMFSLIKNESWGIQDDQIPS